MEDWRSSIDDAMIDTICDRKALNIPPADVPEKKNDVVKEKNVIEKSKARRLPGRQVLGIKIL
jgi:hypothetical protein